MPSGKKVTKAGNRNRPRIEPGSGNVFADLGISNPDLALAKAELDWPSRIEVNSLELVHAYVAGGFGAGLSVKAPGLSAPKGTRAWEIPDCPELTIAAAWRGKLSPLAELVLAGLRKRAKAG